MSPLNELRKRLCLRKEKNPEKYKRLLRGLPNQLRRFAVMVEERKNSATIHAWLEEEALSEKKPDPAVAADIQFCKLVHQLRMVLDNDGWATILQFLGCNTTNAIQSRLERVPTNNDTKENEWMSGPVEGVDEVEAVLIRLLHELYEHDMIDRDETPSDWDTEQYRIVWRRKTD